MSDSSDAVRGESRDRAVVTAFGIDTVVLPVDSTAETTRGSTPHVNRPLSAHLRSTTRARHEQLERELDLLDASLSLDRYRQFLLVASDLVRPLEHQLSAWLGDVFSLPEGDSRTARLDRDLARVSAEPLTTPPLQTVNITTRAEAFGAGYVLQGSLLGGAVIARALRDRLGLSDQCTSYLRTYGDGLGRAWRRFIASLDEFGRRATCDEQQQTVWSALQTFEGFRCAARLRGLARR